MPKEIVTSKFCTFWIPNVAHNDFPIIEEVVSSNNIPGNNDSYYNLTSDITRDRKSNTLSIRLVVTEVSKKQAKSTYTVELESVDTCVSGLIEFEYQLNKHDHNKFQKVVHHAYRLIVQHFHRHIYHDPNNEGVPQAYCSDKKCDLDVEDNDALCFYLTQIHKLVSEQVDMIHDMAPASAIEVDKDGNISQEELDNKRKELEIFYKKCENLRGQMPFFHSLLNSPANKSCHVLSVKAISEKEQELHTIAHNIVNLSNSIVNLFERSKTAFYIRNINTSYDIQTNIRNIASEINKTASENQSLISSVNEANLISSRLGKRSLWISIGLGALSIILGILGLRDKPMSKDNIKAIASEVVMEINNKDSSVNNRNLHDQPSERNNDITKSGKKK